MKNENYLTIHTILMLLVICLLVYFIYLMHMHLDEVRNVVHSLKDYVRENRVDTFPIIP